MKKLLLISLVFSLNAMASFPIIDVKNIGGEYVDEKGNAYAMKAAYELPNVKISHRDIHITFNKKRKNLIISDPSTTVELDFDFSFLNIFKSFSFENLDISSDAKIFNIFSEELDINIDPKKYMIKDFYVETDVRNIPTQDDEDITIVDGLVLNAALKVSKLEFKDDNTSNFFDSLRSENKGKHKEINEIEARGKKGIKIPMIVRNMSYSVKEGLFTGKAKIDSYINLWLRIGGKMTTNKDNTKLEIHLHKAKLGIFSIRSTLLKQVKKLELEGVTVKGRTIHVDLSSVVTGNTGNRQRI